MLFDFNNWKPWELMSWMASHRGFCLILNLTQSPLLLLSGSCAASWIRKKQHCPKLHPERKTHQRGFTIHTHESSHHQSSFFLLSGPILLCFFLRDESHPLIFLTHIPGPSPTRLSSYDSLASAAVFGGLLTRQRQKRVVSHSWENTGMAWQRVGLYPLTNCDIWSKSYFQTF